MADLTAGEITLDQLLEQVARDAGLTLRDLEGRTRGGEIAATRRLAAHLARHLLGIPPSLVALRLGRDDSSFARPLGTLRIRLQVDLELQIRIGRLTLQLRAAAPARNQKSGLTLLPLSCRDPSDGLGHLRSRNTGMHD